MKKQDIAGIIVYVIILALAAVFGLVVIREFASKSGMDTGIFILFIAGAIISGVLFNSILYELGHMLGAKIGGYKITTVSILGFTWYKENNKTKFHFASYDGLTGETKILPKENGKKPSNPVPYMIMGTALYSIEVVAIVLLFSIFTRSGAPAYQNRLAYFFIIIMAVGGVVVFYNIIPFQLDSMTDGYRLRLVSGKKNKEAFNKMLLGETNEENTNGEENNEHVESSFSGDLKLNQVYICLNEDKYIEAETLIDEIIEEAKTNKKVSNKVLAEANANKIYLMFINKGFEATKAFCDENLKLHDKKDLSEESSFPFLRTYILVSALLDRSHSECKRTLDKVYKAYKRTPEGRRPLESKLFNKALDLVIEKHPDWNVEEYKINLD